MKKKEIKEGGHYEAKVSGKLTTVRVDYIVPVQNFCTGRTSVHYWVTNLATGRETTFRSAERFRREVERAKT